MRVAVVTGATRGLGYAIALELGKTGHAVMIASPNAADGHRAARSLAAAAPAGRFVAAQCDVRDPGQVDDLWHATSQALGPADVWVNNAGLALTGRSFVDQEPDELGQMVAINLLGVMHGCRTAALGMAGRGGRIYNMHGAGSDGRLVAGMTGYATTKRAVQYFTKAFAAELEGGPVQVAGISPGLVMTEGFFREHARTPVELRTQREAMVNILGDHAETLAQWIAGIVTAKHRNGREFIWLNQAKIARRAGETPARDVLARYRDAGGNIVFPEVAP